MYKLTQYVNISQLCQDCGCSLVVEENIALGENVKLFQCVTGGGEDFPVRLTVGSFCEHLWQGCKKCGPGAICGPLTIPV